MRLPGGGDLDKQKGGQEMRSPPTEADGSRVQKVTGGLAAFPCWVHCLCSGSREVLPGGWMGGGELLEPRGDPVGISGPSFHTKT